MRIPRLFTAFVLSVPGLAGANTYRIVSDHLGSPRYVVNVANASDVPFSASYSAFGAVTGAGLDWLVFGFAGGIYDADTGLLRYGLRDFDPALGRATARDPARFTGGTNLWVYAANDPVNQRDPTGGLPSMECVESIGKGCQEGCAGSVCPAACEAACLGIAYADEAFGSGGYCPDKDRPRPPDSPPAPKRDCHREAALVYEGCIEDQLADPDTCAKVANFALLKCLAETTGN